MSSVTIYHNPNCGTSRKTLGLIRDAGIEPHIVAYLKTPPTRAQLSDMLTRAGLTPRQAIRTKETIYAELRLEDAGDDALLDAMIAHPVLMERPLVVTDYGVRLCRPAELALEVLPR